MVHVRRIREKIEVDPKDLVYLTIKCLEDGNFTKVIEILNINKSNYAILNGVEFNIMNRAIFDFILISRDIEDREAISNINKIDLITNVSHDLRTPLTSVINYVDFLTNRGDFCE